MLNQALHHGTTYLKRTQHPHLCRAEVNGLYERLFYENVLTELGEGSEVIYLSVANAALAHLPYLVALDHQSRQAGLVLSYLLNADSRNTSNLHETGLGLAIFGRRAPTIPSIKARYATYHVVCGHISASGATGKCHCGTDQSSEAKMWRSLATFGTVRISLCGTGLSDVATNVAKGATGKYHCGYPAIPHSNH